MIPRAMAYESELPWQRLVVGPGGRPFRGLIARDQVLTQEPGHAEVALNVEVDGDYVQSRPALFPVVAARTFLVAPASQGATVLYVQSVAGCPTTTSFSVNVGSQTVTATAVDSYDNIIILSSGLPNAVPVNTVVEVLHSSVDSRLATTGDVTAIGILTVPIAICNDVPHVINDHRLVMASLNVPRATVTSAVTDSISVPVNRINSFRSSDDVVIEDAVSGVMIKRRVLSVSTSTSTIVLTSSVTVPSGSVVYLIGGRQGSGTLVNADKSLIYAARGMQSPYLIEYDDLTQQYVCSTLGVRAPVTSSGVAVSPVNNGSGQLTQGAYQVAIRYYASGIDQESEASTILSVTLGVSHNAIQVTIPASFASNDPRVDYYRIYRSYADAPGSLYLAATVPSTTTSTLLTLGDFALGPLMRLGMDDAPVGINMIAYWRAAGRLIGAASGSNVVRYSDAMNITTGGMRVHAWPIDNTLTIGASGISDAINGIVALRSSVIVIKERSIWRISGIPPNIEVRQIGVGETSSGPGAKYWTSYTSDGQNVFVYGASGVYMLSEDELVDTVRAVRLDEPIRDVWVQGVSGDMRVGSNNSRQAEPIVWNAARRLLCVGATARRWYVCKLSPDLSSAIWSEWRFGYLSTGAFSSSAPLVLCASAIPNDIAGGIGVPFYTGGTVLAGGTGGRVFMVGVGQYDNGTIPYRCQYTSVLVDVDDSGRHSGRRLDVDLDLPWLPVGGIECVVEYDNGKVESRTLTLDGSIAPYHEWYGWPHKVVRRAIRMFLESFGDRMKWSAQADSPVHFRITRLSYWYQPVSIDGSVAVQPQVV